MLNAKLNFDAKRKKVLAFSLQASAFARAGFTMVEIAISLAIIGIALVAIIGVLPLGMRIQRDNRERTVINQDATVLLENIRGGAHGVDDLTNYVMMITNTYPGAPGQPRVFSNPFLMQGPPPPLNPILTGGAQIVGLMSTPDFVDANGNPIPYPGYVTPSFSNHMVAFVYSVSGPAVEKPPQLNSSLVRQSSFSYGVVCGNVIEPLDTNTVNTPYSYSRQLAANLHEQRLLFLWPLLPDSRPPRAHYGTGFQAYRALIPGQLVLDTNLVPGVKLYFFQSQTFTNAP